MIEKFEIKIVKLKTGEDLIGFCFESTENNTVILRHPKIFYVVFELDDEENEEGKEKLVMTEWLHLDAYATQEAPIPREHVLFTTYPTVNFGYRYLEYIMEQLDPDSTLAKQISEAISNSVLENIDPPIGSSVH